MQLVFLMFAQQGSRPPPNVTSNRPNSCSFITPPRHKPVQTAPSKQRAKRCHSSVPFLKCHLSSSKTSTCGCHVPCELLLCCRRCFHPLLPADGYLIRAFSGFCVLATRCEVAVDCERFIIGQFAAHSNARCWGGVLNRTLSSYASPVTRPVRYLCNQAEDARGRGSG